MDSPDLIYQALALNLITLTQAAILRVLRGFMACPEVFPSMRTLERKLAASGRPVSRRTIQRAIASLEDRLSVTIREPVFQPYLGSRRQTSNRFHIQAALDALQALIDRARIAGGRACRRAAAAVKTLAASVSRGVSRGVSPHIKRSDPDLIKNSNPDTRSTTNKQNTTELPSPVVVQRERKESRNTRSTTTPPTTLTDETSQEDLKQALATARAWKLAGNLLRASKDRLVEVVRYVEHRMELHQQHPELVPAISAPAAYAASLLRNPAVDLTIKTPPKVQKAEKRKAVMYAGMTPSPASKIPGETVKNALAATYDRLAAWAEERPEEESAKEALEAVKRLHDEVPGALSRVEVDDIGNRLQSVEKRLLDALTEAYPEAAAEAREEAAEGVEKRLGFLGPKGRASVLAPRVRRRMSVKLGLPRFGLYREEK